MSLQHNLTLEPLTGRLSAQHVPGLDGVRGLAILLVLIYHLAVMIPASDLEHTVFSGLSIGWIGVDLFFVLSGALITGILLDTKSDEGYFRNFYVRRVLRIFPLYYALLIFSFYILPEFHHAKAGRFTRIDGQEIWYWLYLQNFAIAAAGNFRHGIMDVTWSLAIEEQFYLVWPMVVYLSGLRRLTVVCFSLVAGSIALRVILQHLGYAPITLYVLTPTRLDGLCAGALVAIALRHPSLDAWDRERLGRLALVCGGLTTLAVAVISGGLHWDGYLVQTIGYGALASAFAGLTLLTVLQGQSGGALDRLMRWPALTTLGFFAYAIYLFHLPLRAALRDRIMPPAGFPDWPGGVFVAQILFYAAAISLVLLAAWLSYHCYEKWFLGLKPVLTLKASDQQGRAACAPQPALRILS